MMINILGRAVAQENENLKTKSKYPTNNFSLRFFLTDPIIVNMFSI